jgi:hypothetical protein
MVVLFLVYLWLTLGVVTFWTGCNREVRVPEQPTWDGRPRGKAKLVRTASSSDSRQVLCGTFLGPFLASVPTQCNLILGKCCCDFRSSYRLCACVNTVIIGIVEGEGTCKAENVFWRKKSELRRMVVPCLLTVA